MPDRLSRRQFAILAASSTTAALAGCPGGPGGGDGNGTGTGTPGGGNSPIQVDERASVTFEAPVDGATAANGVTVAMHAENFTVEAAGEANDNAGHFHVLIDEDPVEVGEVIPEDETHRHFGDGSARTVLDLEPGRHELTLQAGDGKHRALDLTDTVEVAVEEASVSFAVPEDGATVRNPVPVEFRASENLQVEEAGMMSQTSGHFHVMVNAEAVATGEVIPDDDAHRHFGDGAVEAELDLAPGEYDLVLQMGDGEHRALPATDAISVVVEE